MTDLSEEIGMKISPKAVVDLLLGHISKRCRHYHVLPNEQLPGLKMVLKILTCAAALYTKSYGKIPVLFIEDLPILFIDVVGLLAKIVPDLCGALITFAKILGSSNRIKMVLVSIKGTGMPFL